MFILTLLIIVKNWSNQDILQYVNGKTNCGTLIQWNIISSKKEWGIKYWSSGEWVTKLCYSHTMEDTDQ